MHFAYYADTVVTMQNAARLVLEDGTVFEGASVGADGVSAGELCFTTAPAGYEEAVTDPSYVAQVLCFAYPLVGNYGVDPARRESACVQVEGVVMRRARPLTEAEWAAFDFEAFVERGDWRLPVENKDDSFGVLEGRIVAVDYGSTADSRGRAADRYRDAAGVIAW